MNKPEKNGARSSKSRAPRKPRAREGGTDLSLFNSGLEVWLYDDANADAIRASGAMDFSGLTGGEGTGETFGQLTQRGLIVGYSLLQDDELEVSVYVGDPLTPAELAVAHWLEPQTAFLRLPSGMLCVEPNDSCRVGPEEPTDTGGMVKVPAGDYRVTLYRVDYEALSREQREWRGPQEIIVLTPGGTPADAANDLLPFQPRRDLTWVGKYEISGNKANGLAWFGDYWDTCVLNIDSAAAKQLSLVPGSYFRAHAPTAGVTLISVFAESWTEGRRLPPPTGVPLDDYGYASISPMADWNGAEGLFCRRDVAKTRVESEHHDLWIPVTVEVLDPALHPPATPKPTVAGLTPTDLAPKAYFDPGFMTIILSEVLPGVDDLEELLLPDALKRLDAGLAKAGLTPQGDFEWQEESLHGTTERACRLYAGRDDSFAAILASEGCFDVLLISELEENRWLVTGLADDFESRMREARHRGVSNQAIDVESADEPLDAIVETHTGRLEEAEGAPVTPPSNVAECAEAIQRFLRVAFG